MLVEATKFGSCKNSINENMKNFINNSISFNGNETKKDYLMLKSYLKCVHDMNKNILNDVYCLHAIKNDFN